jgi:hypothetical protein
MSVGIRNLVGQLWWAPTLLPNTKLGCASDKRTSLQDCSINYDHKNFAVWYRRNLMTFRPYSNIYLTLKTAWFIPTLDVANLNFKLERHRFKDRKTFNICAYMCNTCVHLCNIYVHVYICVYMCIYVYICVYMCIYVYICVYMCIYVYICVYMCIYVYYVYICVYMCIYVFICVYMCIMCIYVYICVYMCLYVYICVYMCRSR